MTIMQSHCSYNEKENLKWRTVRNAYQRKNNLKYFGIFMIPILFTTNVVAFVAEAPHLGLVSSSNNDNNNDNIQFPIR